MKTRHSPRRRSSSCSSSTSPRRRPAEQHGLSHGPVPIGAQRRHQRLDFVGVQDARQTPHPTQEGCTDLAAVAVAPGGQTPWHRIGHHAGITTDDEIAIEARDRSQTPLDGRGPTSPTRRRRSAPRSRRPSSGAAGRSRTEARPWGSPRRSLRRRPRRRRSGHGHRPAPWAGRALPEANSKNSSTSSWPTRYSWYTVGAKTTLKRRTPHHRTPPCRTSRPKKAPRTLSPGGGSPM